MAFPIDSDYVRGLVSGFKKMALSAIATSMCSRAKSPATKEKKVKIDDTEIIYSTSVDLSTTFTSPIDLNSGAPPQLQEEALIKVLSVLPYPLPMVEINFKKNEEKFVWPTYGGDMTMWVSPTHKAYCAYGKVNKGDTMYVGAYVGSIWGGVFSEGVTKKLEYKFDRDCKCLYAEAYLEDPEAEFMGNNKFKLSTKLHVILRDAEDTYGLAPFIFHYTDWPVNKYYKSNYVTADIIYGYNPQNSVKVTKPGTYRFKEVTVGNKQEWSYSEYPVVDFSITCAKEYHQETSSSQTAFPVLSRIEYMINVELLKGTGLIKPDKSGKYVLTPYVKVDNFKIYTQETLNELGIKDKSWLDAIEIDGEFYLQ